MLELGHAAVVELPAEQGPCCDGAMLRQAHAATALPLGHAAAGLLSGHAEGGFLVGRALMLPRHERLPLPVLAQLHA